MVHHQRDVTLREDASRIRTGHAPCVMAGLRNTALGLADLAGLRNLAAAVDHCGHTPTTHSTSSPPRPRRGHSVTLHIELLPCR